jgi:DNA phosphorothioation-dependent restriction protein DptG
MKLFGKKNEVMDEETKKLNELLDIALEFNESTGTWYELPSDVPEDVAKKVIEVRKMVFEYIRQLKENRVYGNKAVYDFAKESYPWVSKANINKCIHWGQYF